MADASVFELFARLIVALAVVIGLMVVCARLLKKRGIDLTAGSRRNSSNRQTIEVVARRGLTKGTSVAIVHAAGKSLVLGVTDQRVTLLSESEIVNLPGDLIGSDSNDNFEGAHWTGLSQTANVSQVRGGSPWKMALETLRERTVRR